MTSPTGPITGLMTMCAAAVGAGIVLGGFVAGSLGLLVSLRGEELESSVRTGGYWGGAFALVGLAVDAVIL